MSNEYQKRLNDWLRDFPNSLVPAYLAPEVAMAVQKATKRGNASLAAEIKFQLEYAAKYGQYVR